MAHYDVILVGGGGAGMAAAIEAADARTLREALTACSLGRMRKKSLRLELIDMSDNMLQLVDERYSNPLRHQPNSIA